MATSATAQNRPLIAWLFIIAGALLLVETLILLFGSPAPGSFGTVLIFVVRAALAVAYVLLALTRTKDGLLRVAFVVAAIGWVLLALISFIPGLGTVGSIASVLALIGMLGSGILVFLRHFFTRNGDIVYLIMTIVGALILLSGVRPFLFGYAATVFNIVFAALLVITGVVLQRRR
jgi:hypothetical protein